MLMRSPLASPSLENLSFILRRPDLWPDQFSWDFTFRFACAIGLAYGMWEADKVRAMFDAIDVYEFESIFCRACNKPRVHVFLWFTRERRHSEVTPEMVADQIDEYLARQPQKYTF